MEDVVFGRYREKYLRETKFVDGTIKTIWSKDELNKFLIKPKLALRFFESSPETAMSFFHLNMYQDKHFMRKTEELYNFSWS